MATHPEAQELQNEVIELLQQDNLDEEKKEKLKRKLAILKHDFHVDVRALEESVRGNFLNRLASDFLGWIDTNKNKRNITNKDATKTSETDKLLINGIEYSVFLDQNGIVLSILSEGENIPNVKPELRDVNMRFEVTNAEEKSPNSLHVVVKHGNRLFLTQERGDNFANLPGGRPNPGETPRRTAVREVPEETGIVFDEERLVPIGVFKLKSGDAEYHFAVYQVDIKDATGIVSPSSTDPDDKIDHIYEVPISSLGITYPKNSSIQKLVERLRDG